ncbi:MAG: transcription-repair coupling factor [Eubacteriales bacterium]|nr:transcription-repair coupling factor [Eubacteriales bacterium]
MKVLTAPLEELAEFEEGKRLLEKEGAAVGFAGLYDSQKLHMIYGLSDGFCQKIIVTFSDKKAREISEEYRFYDRGTYLYPAKDLIFYQADVAGGELTRERMRVLRVLLEKKPATIVTTFAALMMPQVPLSEIEKRVLSFDKLSSIDETELSRKLVEMGYEKSWQVEVPGQFSIRGGIIDIFDMTEENPYRIELWGDSVDSIRSFDVLSQRSVENLSSVRIYPATELMLSEGRRHDGFLKIEKETKAFAKKMREEGKAEEAHRIEAQIRELKESAQEFAGVVNLESFVHYFYPETESFLQFFDPAAAVVFLDEPQRLSENADALEAEFRESMVNRLEKGYILPGQADLLCAQKQVSAYLTRYRAVGLSAIDARNALFRAERKFEITVRSIASYNNSFEALLKDLKRYKKTGSRVLLLCASRTRAKRLAMDLREQELTAFYSEDPDRVVQPGEVELFYGHVAKGFEYPLLKFAVISEGDIFGAEKKKKRKKRQYEGTKIRDFAELKVGDYVVHETHGLGVYQGIEKVQMEGTIKDYMKISYRDGGNLYVLATGLDVIQKYASADAAKKPKLNKLGTQEWTKTKSRVRTAVDEVAKDLVELYAVRQQSEGYAFSEDTIWQKEFEEVFPFEETEDQLSAIAATKRDMESKKIMDRLVCGDVGYGKTEIAIRAAFKAVQDSKQVVFLVPTTILAQQHYNTFTQRMKDFPVRIDLMSRFRTPAQQKKTIEDLKKGLVDIVIGTHRVLSSDIRYKDLGLLIIDEEQRFGVTHKEKIKKMKENVDVLTLTATPIPRTLHMSLVGIRDMSVLEEAPEDRLPIQTYVMEYNDEMVREAIVRELSRNGQVYYVYNRVNNIADVAAQIGKLVPEASVAFAHGQMNERELERIMYDFINGEIDVLVATTIIETGLDISNVNTIIIHDSDQMGLSQLYQLRGRVGRSNRTAYAFLMYKRDKMLKEVAEKRLAAIREFTDLGSGFKIAMKDLEIRGAGNLLGERQHGHMEAVGYDLYCKMLNEAVKGLKGIQTVPDFTTTVELDVDAFIPPSYIVNEQQKLDIYKRIAGVETAAESDEMKEELLDRFGAVPKSVDNLLRIALMRVQAHQLYIMELKGRPGEIRFVYRPDAKVHGENIPKLLNLYGERLKFLPQGNPVFTYRYPKSSLVEQKAEELLTFSEKVLNDMKKYLRDGAV